MKKCPQCEIYEEAINQLVKGGIDTPPCKVNPDQAFMPPRSLKQLINAAFEQLDNGDTDGTRDYLFNALLLVNDQPDAKNTCLSNLLHDAIDECNAPEFSVVQGYLFTALGALENPDGKKCIHPESSECVLTCYDCDPESNPEYDHHQIHRHTVTSLCRLENEIGYALDTINHVAKMLDTEANEDPGFYVSILKSAAAQLLICCDDSIRIRKLHTDAIPDMAE